MPKSLGFHKIENKFLLSRLQKTKRTFSIPEVEEFIKSFMCRPLKAKSSVKSDIRIVIHDQRTGTNPKLGFSIKSKLGGASTLPDAGKTTNFIFKISISKLFKNQIDEINEINTRSKIKDRIQKIVKNGGALDFVKLESITFNNNLTLIDSALPEILSKIVYLFFTSNKSECQQKNIQYNK